MATEAEALLTGTGSLLGPLRTPGTYERIIVPDARSDAETSIKQTAAAAQKRPSVIMRWKAILTRLPTRPG
jgi:hypothetical protein